MNEKRLMKWIVLTLLFSIFLLADSARADDRKRVIDFEDELIEGVNKRPLDSLSQISERNRGRKKTHLYKKRFGFSTETRQTLKEMRYFQ